MSKIMLVLDNRDDQDFLEKVLVKLKYTVIAMREGVDLSLQLIDHFPDVVFASTLGRNQKILSALGKIKEARGKPKLVFVKQQGESTRLNEEQKKIIDGVIYSPVDPFKLIDLLAATTEVGKTELRRRYNEMLEQERGTRRSFRPADDNASIEVKGKVTGYGEGDHPVSVLGEIGCDREGFKKEYGKTQVFGKPSSPSEVDVEDEPFGSDFGGAGVAGGSPSKKGGMFDLGKEIGFQTPQSKSEEPGPGEIQESSTKADAADSSSLIHDEKRKSKYSEIASRLKTQNPNPTPLDVEKLRSKQREQSAKVQEDKTIKESRKHFLKTMFSMSPDDVKKKSS